jgi:hypothetical protein
LKLLLSQSVALIHDSGLGMSIVSGTICAGKSNPVFSIDTHTTLRLDENKEKGQHIIITGFYDE